MRIGKGPSPYFRHKYILAKPPRHEYLGWLIGALLLVALGAGLWFARPYLPDWPALSWPAATPQPEEGPRVAELPLPPPAPPVALPPTPAQTPETAPPAPVASVIPLTLPPPAAPPPLPVTPPVAPALPASAPAEPPPLPVTPPVAPALPASAPVETPPPAPAVAVAPAEPITPPAPAVAQADKEEIEKLVAQADAQLEAKRLTSPAGNNAYQTYRQLAERAPEEAGKLLDRIVVHYLELARKRLEQEDNPQAALETRRKMQEIAPEHQASEVLLGEILAHLLARAEAHMQARRYTTPARDNAYDSYQEILKIEPDNAQARAGLKQIAEVYLGLARARLAQGQTDTGLSLIERGLSAMPEHPGLLALRKEAQQARQAAIRQEPPATQPSAPPPATEPATPPPTAPTAPTGGALQDLLQRAERQLAQGQLVRPAGDNAYATYNEVLRQFPDNPQARNGLRQIADRYYQLAVERMEQGSYQQTLGLIGEGLAIAPNHAELLKLKRQVLEKIPQDSE